uniref:ISXO2-like transposase domain-containing protein n=1 Tax=Anopheles arabiensis TaxID=7173 RepID=A0A182IEA6_ANOAR
TYTDAGGPVAVPVEYQCQRGRSGEAVEIDETKITSRKYNRGQLTRTDKEWLVDDGTTILTDSWGGYVSLAEVGYSHGMVNHSKNFVHPDNKFIHTEKVENLWRWLKDLLKEKGTYRITHLN